MRMAVVIATAILAIVFSLHGATLSVDRHAPFLLMLFAAMALCALGGGLALAKLISTRRIYLDLYGIAAASCLGVLLASFTTVSHTAAFAENVSLPLLTLLVVAGAKRMVDVSSAFDRDTPSSPVSGAQLWRVAMYVAVAVLAGAWLAAQPARLTPRQPTTLTEEQIQQAIAAFPRNASRTVLSNGGFRIAWGVGLLRPGERKPDKIMTAATREVVADGRRVELMGVSLELPRPAEETNRSPDIVVAPDGTPLSPESLAGRLFQRNDAFGTTVRLPRWILAVRFGRHSNMIFQPQPPQLAAAHGGTTLVSEIRAGKPHTTADDDVELWRFGWNYVWSMPMELRLRWWSAPQPFGEVSASTTGTVLRTEDNLIEIVGVRYADGGIFVSGKYTELRAPESDAEPRLIVGFAVPRLRTQYTIDVRTTDGRQLSCRNFMLAGHVTTYHLPCPPEEIASFLIERYTSLIEARFPIAPLPGLPPPPVKIDLLDLPIPYAEIDQQHDVRWYLRRYLGDQYHHRVLRPAALDNSVWRDTTPRALLEAYFPGQWYVSGNEVYVHPGVDARFLDMVARAMEL